MSHWNDQQWNWNQPIPQHEFPQPRVFTLQEVESRQLAHHNSSNQLPAEYNHMTMIDVSNSNLQPTAQEFQPINNGQQQQTIIPGVSQTQEHVQDNSNAKLHHTGAIKRNNYNSRQQHQTNKFKNEKKDKDSNSKHKQSDNNASESTQESTSQKSSGLNKDKRKGGQAQAQTGGNKYNNQNHSESGNSFYGNSKFNRNNRNHNGHYNNSKESPRENNYRDWRSNRNYERSSYNERFSNDQGYKERSFNERSSKERSSNSDRSSNERGYNYDRAERSTHDQNYKDRSYENWRQSSNNSRPNSHQSSNQSFKNTAKENDSGATKETKENKQITSNVSSVKSRVNVAKKKLDAASQRERLVHMVLHRMLECLVCCEKLRHTDKIWSCKQCFHILHLNCIQKWARSSQLESGWRCPACQNVLNDVPNEYRCYCDKWKDPPFEPPLLPHSCGEVCRRKGRTCEHTCTLLCHPGPCPDCSAMIARPCGCGRTAPIVECRSTLLITCDNICGKTLNCGVHECTAKCHSDECKPCTVQLKKECFCGKQGKKITCTQETSGITHYACGDVCGKLLSCGNHKCSKLCHEGECEACSSHPNVVKTCSCGKEVLTVERTSCLDPIPCCDNVCGKKLKCGQPHQPHLCEAKCHLGDCPICPLTTKVRCRCGRMDRELPCKNLTTKADDVRCQKKCTKKRFCMKHKCNQFCCIDIDHECPLPCTRMLSCGVHRCELNCHPGKCPTCWRTSFEELYCECGASVLYPPIPCGTRAPECKKPCSRPRECGHEPHHTCHTGPCPPCTLFTSKLCHGGHVSRKTIPCHQASFSCGLPCGKDMPCGRHTCIQVCHEGPCPTPCVQPCTIPRPNCEHLCGQPCHEPPCPSTPCKQTVVVSCQCGLRSSTKICMDIAGEYQKIAMIQLASKMADIQRGQSVDITDMVNKQKKGGIHKTLECNDECRLVERNRRMAIGLQLRNPDLSAKLTPRYSDFMKQWAKKDQRFCQHVHDKLTELVQLAKQSKQKNRSHSFECMNRDKRHFVHEYCEHFGVESAAYDAEPNRNIVATASKEKSWLPSCSVIELLQRENGQRKVPGPVNSTMQRNLLPNSSNTQKGESVSLRLQPRNLGGGTSTDRIRPKTPPGEYIDYFDNPQ